MSEPNAGASGAAPPLLDYRGPERPPHWQLRPEADQVTLSVKGPPAWSQITSTTVALLTSGTFAASAAVLVLMGMTRTRSLGPDTGVLFVLAAVFGRVAVRRAARLQGLIRYGPARRVYHLTSRGLGANTDPSTLLDGAPVLRVRDAAAASGRLRFTGRRELLLRLLLADRSLVQVPWPGTRAELEGFADDLRAALRLDEGDDHR